MRPTDAAAAKAAAALEPLAEVFAGQTALLFAPGPSLTNLWSPERPIPFPSIAVNDAWRIAPNADILYASDKRWWSHHECVPQFHGAKVSCDGNSFREVICLQISGGPGYDPRPGWLRHGSNSGYAALHLAAQLGAKRIVLVGYDMRKVAGRSHFFGEHPPEVRTNVSNYAGWALNYVELGKELAKRGVEVLNATSGSGLGKTFPRVNLEELCKP